MTVLLAYLPANLSFKLFCHMLLMQSKEREYVVLCVTTSVTHDWSKRLYLTKHDSPLSIYKLDTSCLQFPGWLIAVGIQYTNQ